ncbi:MAG: antirestriction protein ArdA [Candidatus Thiodiazotropha endolucinida]
MTEFYAQPYSIEHTGFYFNSFEKFETGMEELNKKGCEEVEIQFIDGEDHLARLADAANVDQGNVDTWFDVLEDLEEDEVTQLLFLCDCGYSLSEALGRYEDVCLYQGTASDYAYDLINETTEVPEHLSYYIDYDAIARDMKINGEIVELSYDLIVTNANEF